MFLVGLDGTQQLTDYVVASNSTFQDITSNVETVLSWDVNTIVGGNFMHSATVNPSRFVAIRTKFYYVRLAVLLDPKHGSQHIIRLSLRKNGVTFLRQSIHNRPGTAIAAYPYGDQSETIELGALLSLNATEYLEASVYVTGIGSRLYGNDLATFGYNVEPSAGVIPSTFSMMSVEGTP